MKKYPFGVGLAHEALFSNVQKITSAEDLRLRASDQKAKVKKIHKKITLLQHVTNYCVYLQRAFYTLLILL